MAVNEPTDNVWTCPAGGLHDWNYLGQAKQAYRCLKCAETVTKGRLKEETD